MLHGYARVSTQDQNLELQSLSPDQGRMPEGFENKITDTRAERLALATALKILSKGGYSRCLGVGSSWLKH